VHAGGAPVQNEPGGQERMPESTPSEGSGWTDVVMEMPSITLAPLLPIVNPLIVTTKGDVPITDADVVKTSSEVELELVLLHATASSATLVALALTYGVHGAKKLEG
jgi:hypothetical protein